MAIEYVYSYKDEYAIESLAPIKEYGVTIKNRKNKKYYSAFNSSLDNTLGLIKTIRGAGHKSCEIVSRQIKLKVPKLEYALVCNELVDWYDESINIPINGEYRTEFSEHKEGLIKIRRKHDIQGSGREFKIIERVKKT